jgi:hypothetical protein
MYLNNYFSFEIWLNKIEKCFLLMNNMNLFDFFNFVTNFAKKMKYNKFLPFILINSTIVFILFSLIFRHKFELILIFLSLKYL